MMTSVNMLAKRRRLDNAKSTLTKPFKSPLRRPVQANNEKVDDKSSSTESPRSTISEKDETNTPAPTSTPLPSKATTPTPIPGPTSQTRKRKTTTITNTITPTKKSSILLDPELSALQKHHRTLQSRLATLHADLDNAKQALRIESSNRDTELESLISKWRVISQDAAEEVFVGAQEKVARMGGMGAWREQMRSQQERWEREEMEDWFGSGEAAGGEVDYGEEDGIVRRKEEVLEELGAAKEKEKRMEKGDENEEFTMDCMLKTLNIDPQMIGFDTAGQKWIKN